MRVGDGGQDHPAVARRSRAYTRTAGRCGLLHDVRRSGLMVLMLSIVAAPMGFQPLTASAAGETYSASSTKQYVLSSSDGSTWQDMDPTPLLSVTFTASGTTTAIISASSSLFTSVSGYSQDLAIASSSDNGPWNVLSWKEGSGASAFSPTPIAAMATLAVTANHNYTIKLQWKSSIALAGGATLYAGAGSSAPYSQSSLIVQTAGSAPSEVTSTQQYHLGSSDGSTWQDIDTTGLLLQVTPSSSGNMILSAAADLWTDTAAPNRDLGISVAVGTSQPSVVAWTESGNAASYAAKATTVQAVLSVSNGTQYTIRLVWKGNIAFTGRNFYAGAGPQAPFSPTRLTAQAPASASSLYSKSSTQQYTLPSSDGSTWQDMDSANLALTITPTANCQAVITASADLFTSPNGPNQDLGISISSPSTSIAAWVESGEGAPYSPTATFIQAVVSMTANTAYTVKLDWKSNAAFSTPTTLYAGAGLGPIVYSPTSLIVQMSTCVGSAPSGVAALAIGNASASVSWTAPSDGSPVDHYLVTPYRAGVAQAPVPTANSNTTFTVTGLTCNTSYTFTVSAVNTAGTSPPSPTPSAAGVMSCASDLARLSPGATITGPPGHYDPGAPCVQGPYSASLNPICAIDGDDNTYYDAGLNYAGGPPQGQWLLLDLGYPASAASLRVRQRWGDQSFGDPCNNVYTFELQSSDDGQTFVKVFDLPMNGRDASGSFANTAPHRWWRLYALSGATYNNGCGMVVGTFAIFGAATQMPNGGPLSYSDLIGGRNFCLPCLMAKFSSFFRHLVGMPVDSYNGAFSHDFADFSVPGHGRSLALSRSYYAYPDDPTNLASHKTVPNGPFGFGWTFNYNVSLAVTGTSPNQIATVTQETGATTVFNQPASGSAWAPAVPRTVATLVKHGDGTWTLIRQATDILNFDASGRLSSLNDLNNHPTNLSYNGSNQLTDATDSEGRVLHFVWNGTGAGAEIASATILYATSGARTETFSYDGSGNLHTATDVGSGQWTFGYDPNHRMTTMQKPRLNTVTNHYDSNNRVDWQEDELSRRTCFDYTSIPGATKVTDPSGVNACGGSVRVDYYTFGMLSNTTKGYGTSDAATWSYGHDPNTLLVTATVDPLGHGSYASYDANGNMLNATDPLGRTTTNTYNPQNQVLTTTDPSNVTTTYGYDPTGINLASVSRPLTSTGQTATTTYAYASTGGCAAGDMTSLTDADSKIWSYTCNTHGYRITTRDPLGNVAAAVYDENGWMTSSFTPMAGCTTGQAPPTGCSGTYRTQYDHDPFGRVTTTTDPLAHTTVRHYDANGNLDRFTDGVTNTTYTGYSSADEPCWSGVFASAATWSGTKCADSPPSGFHQQTTYNADGTVAAEIDGRGKNTVAFAYDNQKRMKTVADALHTAQTYAYNGDGTVATLTDNQSTPRVTTYSYDAGAQLTSVSYSDGSTPNITSIGYDALGRRTSLVDNISGGQTSTWGYDSLGRLNTYTPGSLTASTVTYGYDLKGQQTGVTYPGQTTPLSRTFDDAGRMATVQDWAGHKTVFGYDANSNLTTETFPNATDTSSMVDTFAFDAADRLQNPTASQPTITYTKGGTSYAGFTYARDGANRLTNESATGMPGTLLGSVNYTPLSQVQNVHGGPAYSYDAADNPTSLAGGTAQTYDDANQLCWWYASANACGSGAPATGLSTQFTYDTRGNRTAAVPYSGGSAQTATCYAYDQRSLMTQLSTGTGTACATPTTTATYTYDGTGARTSKTVGATTTNFLWDPSGRLPMLLREVAGSTTNYYIYGPGGTPLEQISGSTFLYYHQDQLGSTRAITDAAGAVKATYTYDAYGSVRACTGAAVTVNGSNICTGTISVSNPLCYAGQYTDAESGLIYLRARYYDPSTAQFVSRDPAVAMTRQPYAYVNDNPLNATDPMGLCDFFGCIGVIAQGLHDLPGAIAHDAGQGQQNFVVNMQSPLGLGVVVPLAAAATLATGGLIWEGGSALAGTSGGGAAITGFTRHGLNQMISNDEHGVCNEALLDTVKSPISTELQQGAQGATTLYQGQNAVVVLNQAGRVVTTWATNSKGWRY